MENFSIPAIAFPCLRCGCAGVHVSLLSPLVRREQITSWCCDAEHLLEIAKNQNGYSVSYQRYTLRYPIEFYDPISIPEVRVSVARNSPIPESDGFIGPVTVLKRKRRFSKAEIAKIWEQSSGRCHLCNKRWRISDRRTDGWHVDHVIPNVGGGYDTESMPNFRVACAKCNLKKGRGYSEIDIKNAIHALISHYDKMAERMANFYKSKRKDG